MSKCALCNKADTNLHPVHRRRTAPKICTKCAKDIRLGTPTTA
jgi:hypothetical protein